jgi:hypothetical protein
MGYEGIKNARYDDANSNTADRDRPVKAATVLEL